MRQAVLLLNADYTPIKVLSWQRAMVLLLEEKVHLVSAYADRAIRSATASFPFPAVVVLKRYANFAQKVKFNRQNVLARDEHKCQYCGVQPRRRSGAPLLESLTIDHVVPRAQSRDGRVLLPWSKTHVPVTSWENVTTACMDCNTRKADRTPSEAGMPLKKLPRVPSQWDVLWMAVHWYDVPHEWKDWLPADSPWREYWEVELEKT
jgi:5-methylcytosine-specific restriction endonuclease McrA